MVARESEPAPANISEEVICESCKSPYHQIYKTRTPKDGPFIRVRYHICNYCHSRFQSYVRRNPDRVEKKN